MKLIKGLLLIALIVLCNNLAIANAPRNLRVIYEYNSQTHDILASQDILQRVYGDSWSNSLAARIVRIVSTDRSTASHFRRLLARASSPVTIHIHYDNPDHLFEGERVNVAGVGNRRVNAIGDRTDRLDWIIQRQLVLRRSASTRVFGPPRTLTDEERERARRLRQETLTEERNGYRFHVWPQAGNTIHMPHRLDNRPGLIGYGQTDARLAGLLVHELSHTQDRTALPRGSYGADRTHYLHEVTNPTASFIEGWANYNQSLVDSINRLHVFAACSSISTEDDEGEYNRVSSPSFAQHMSTEGVSAAIFLGLDSNGTKRNAIMRSFNATNRRSRNTMDVLRHYASGNDDDANRLAAIVDVVTNFTGSASDLSALSDDYMEQRDGIRQSWQAHQSSGGSLDSFIAGLTCQPQAAEAPQPAASSPSKQGGSVAGSKLGLLGVD